MAAKKKLSPLALRIQSRLDAIGKSARSASLEAGLSASAIKNIFDGQSESPRGKTLTALARVLQTSEEWLLKDGDARPALKLVESYDPDKRPDEEINEKKEDEGQREGRAPTRAPGAVREFDLRAGASYGGGYALDGNVEDEGKIQAKAEWVLPEAWLKGEMRLSTAFTDIIAIDGPSMLPDLVPGDRVLIDRSNRDPKQDAIFAIRDGDSIIVKHVQLIRNSNPPRIVCRSSNPKYEPFELILDGDHVDIIGRVAGRITKL